MAETFTDALVRWIVENVDVTVVPGDEGNDDALIYNLVQLARHGRPYRAYNYEADQNAELKQLKLQFGIVTPAALRPCLPGGDHDWRHDFGEGELKTMICTRCDYLAFWTTIEQERAALNRSTWQP